MIASGSVNLQVSLSETKAVASFKIFNLKAE